jgi:hypothetical protein
MVSFSLSIVVTTAVRCELLLKGCGGEKGEADIAFVIIQNSKSKYPFSADTAANRRPVLKYKV